MILVIDNYDSFVYNLARYIELAGHTTQVIRNNQLSLAQIRELKPSHIIISPGPCAPNQAGISLALVKHFYQFVPILGVCLGHQVIGQAFGATITRALHPMHGKASRIRHNEQGIFRGIDNPSLVGRYHSLIVANENFPDQLEITASSTQGEIMALQHRHYPTIGVQFHPEAILTKQGQQMIDNFVKLTV